MIRLSPGSALHLHIPELPEVIEGAQPDSSPVESLVLGGEDRLFHVVEPHTDVAGGGIADDLHLVPRAFLPRRAGGAEGGDRLAVGLVHDVDLVVRLIRLFAEVGVVEAVFRGAAEGDAEVVVAGVELGEPQFRGQGEVLPLLALEPREVEGAAVFWLRRALRHELQDALPSLPAPFPSLGVAEGPLGGIGEKVALEGGGAAVSGAARRQLDLRWFFGGGQRGGGSEQGKEDGSFHAPTMEGAAVKASRRENRLPPLGGDACLEGQ